MVKRLTDIIRWTLFTIVAVLMALLTASFVMSNRVAGILLASLNREIGTKVEIGSYRLSLIRKFPKASIELKNITILSSHGFDTGQFRGINTDTLLRARSASLEFRMTDIMKGNYNIQRISVSGARLNLFSDSSGRVNYEISSTRNNEKTGADSTTVNLDKIVVAGMQIRYINRATSLDLSGTLTNGRFKSSLSGKEFNLSCNASFRITNIELFSTHVKVNTAGSIDLSLHQSDSGLVIRKGILKLDDFRFSVSGKISSSDMIDLSIAGQQDARQRRRHAILGDGERGL